MAETLTTRTLINTGGTDIAIGVSDRGTTYGVAQLAELVMPDESGTLPVPVYGYRAPANSADASVTTSSTSMASALATRSSLTVENKGAVDILYGPSGVTATSYFGRIQPGDTHVLYREDACYLAWSWIVASGTCAAHVSSV